MPLVFLNKVLALAGVTFLVASVIFLVWAFLSKRGLPRKRLLIASLSSFLLFLAAPISTYTLLYLVQLPAMLLVQSPAIAAPNDPGFRPPYAGWNGILYASGLGLLLVSVGLLAWGLLRPRGARSRILLASLGSLLLFLTVGAAHYSLVYSTQVPAHRRYVFYTPGTRAFVGDPVPDVLLTKLDGTTAPLAEFRGKVVVLNFFATWCGPCIKELPHLQELWNDLRDNEDFTMLVVGREESAETVAAFKAKNGYTFPMALDPDRSATGKTGKFADSYIPRTYVISRDGTILFQATGFCELDENPANLEIGQFYQSELVRLRKIVDEELMNKGAE